MKWLLILLAAGAAAGAYFAFSGDDKPTDKPPVPKVVKPADHVHVLLVGCTEYPNLQKEYDAEDYNDSVRLVGPAHDVEMLRNTFEDYLGVPSEQITVLSGWPDDESKRPTQENILGHLKRMAKERKAGDRVIFHFSGHGSQQNDTGETDELDRLDEILLPADVRQWDGGLGEVPGSITDDVLWAHIEPIRKAGASVWVSLDCCHSGSGIRGVAVRTRNIDPSLLGVDEPRGLGPAPAVARDVDLTRIVSTSAAQSYQLAPEMVLPDDDRYRDRRFHGLYSFILARTLQRYGGALTFAQLHEHLQIGYQTLPWDAASPHIEGDTDLHVVAGQGVTARALRLRKTDEGLVLNAGGIRGLATGTTLDVYRPDNLGTPEGRLGCVRITDAGLMRSLCEWLPDDAADTSTLPNAPLPVKVRQVEVGEITIPIAFVDADGKWVDPPYNQEIEDALQTDLMKRFPRAPPEQAHWWLRLGDEMTLERVESGYESPRFRVKAGDLQTTLFRIFRAQSLRRLAAGTTLTALPKGVTVKAFVAETEDGKRTPLVAGAKMVPGTWLSLEVHNTSRRAIDLTILMLDANYGVSAVFPGRRGDPRLVKTQNSPMPLGPWPLSDDAFGAESLLILAVPREDNDPKIQFRDLAQTALGLARSGKPGSGGIPVLLRNLVRGEGQTRGATVDPEAMAVTLIPWRTQWGRVAIPADVKSRGIPLDAAARGRRTEATDAHPWFLGTHLTVLHDEGVAGAIATWDDEVESIYLRAAGYPGTPQELAAQIEQGTLEADMVLHLSRRKRVAWYRQQGETKLSYYLVDAGGDPSADMKIVIDGSRYIRKNTRLPWLCTGHLQAPFKEVRAPLIRRLRDFVRLK